MDDLLFDVDLYEVQIEQLNNEYKCLQDIYARFLSEVISKSDKIDDFKIKANEIREDLQKIEEQIFSLKKKAESIKELYLSVEEINLQLVEDLPSAADVLDGREVGAIGPVINSRYRVIYDDSAYVVNGNYDFEDWLVDWLNTSGNRL